MQRGVIFFFTGLAVLVLAVFAANLITTPVAAAEPFPTKSITWLVPYSPGGGFDLHSRAVVRGLKRKLGVSVIIKNVPGAGGNIGWNLLWKSKPDGHTLGIINIPGAIVSELYGKPKPQYRLRKFSWIGRISAAPYVWAVGAKTRYRKLEDLQKAREVLVADVGVGGTAWVTAVLTANVMNFKPKFILGYRGAPAANMGIVRGEGEARALGLDSPGQMRFIREGDLIPLWVYLEKRDPEFPNVPTVGELGYPELTMLASNRVVAAPPGVPKDRLEVLRKAFAEAIKNPEVLKSFEKMKAKPSPVIGEEWVSMLKNMFNLMEKHSNVFVEALP
ncbi:MAG: Bug family tripartite tricarboxylate transporter substrate binding protein [Candidatus Binatia bacterium]